ncbi:rRNA maturation RNase YbeY, partial [Mycoplasmopsis pullorum]
MNKTEKSILIIDNETEFEFLYEVEFKQILNNLIEYFKIDKTVEVDVTITDNETIRELNKNYRGKDYATDILSFDFADEELYQSMPLRHLGELVISYEKVLSQAQEFNH